MIKIGRMIDVEMVEEIPKEIEKAVLEDLETFDWYYGGNRDIDMDMGGFVVICGKNEEIDILDFDIDKLEKKFDNLADVPEYEDKINGWTKRLFISGSERNIIIYQEM